MELRNTGKTALSLIYDAKLSQIHGQLTLIEKGIKVPLIIDDQAFKFRSYMPQARSPGPATEAERVTLFSR